MGAHGPSVGLNYDGKRTTQPTEADRKELDELVAAGPVECNCCGPSLGLDHDEACDVSISAEREKVGA